MDVCEVNNRNSGGEQTVISKRNKIFLVFEKLIKDIIKSNRNESIRQKSAITNTKIWQMTCDFLTVAEMASLLEGYEIKDINNANVKELLLMNSLYIAAKKTIPEMIEEKRMVENSLTPKEIDNPDIQKLIDPEFMHLCEKKIALLAEAINKNNSQGASKDMVIKWLNEGAHSEKIRNRAHLIEIAKTTEDVNIIKLFSSICFDNYDDKEFLYSLSCNENITEDIIIEMININNTEVRKNIIIHKNFPTQIIFKKFNSNRKELYDLNFLLDKILHKRHHLSQQLEELQIKIHHFEEGGDKNTLLHKEYARYEEELNLIKNELKEINNKIKRANIENDNIINTIMLASSDKMLEDENLGNFVIEIVNSSSFFLDDSFISEQNRKLLSTKAVFLLDQEKLLQHLNPKTDDPEENLSSNELLAMNPYIQEIPGLIDKLIDSKQASVIFNLLANENSDLLSDEHIAKILRLVGKEELLEEALSLDPITNKNVLFALIFHKKMLYPKFIKVREEVVNHLIDSLEKGDHLETINIYSAGIDKALRYNLLVDEQIIELVNKKLPFKSFNYYKNWASSPQTPNAILEEMQQSVFDENNLLDDRRKLAHALIQNPKVGRDFIIKALKNFQINAGLVYSALQNVNINEEGNQNNTVIMLITDKLLEMRMESDFEKYVFRSIVHDLCLASDSGKHLLSYIMKKFYESNSDKVAFLPTAQKIMILEQYNKFFHFYE